MCIFFLHYSIHRTAEWVTEILRDIEALEVISSTQKITFDFSNILTQGTAPGKKENPIS